MANVKGHNQDIVCSYSHHRIQAPTDSAGLFLFFLKLQAMKTSKLLLLMSSLHHLTCTTSNGCIDEWHEKQNTAKLTVSPARCVSYYKGLLPVVVSK